MGQMTTARTAPTRAAATGVAQSTRSEDLLTMAGATWMIVGLFIDGYAHLNLLEGEESFFTIYHAIFYSGFAVSAGAVYRIARARARTDLPIHRWLPDGYPSAAVGLLVFGLGGTSDAIWHSVFGIEKGIDALLSPSHTMLFVGALLIVTAPLRSGWSRPGGHDSWSALVSAVISMTSTLCLVGFFGAYMWGMGFAEESATPYDPVTGVGDDALILGVSTAMISTAVLFGGFGLMARRWRLPIGATSVMLIVPNTMIIGAFDYDANGITAMIVTALLTEAVLARPTPDRWWPTAKRVLIVSPAVLWLTIFALRASYGTVAWQTELWAGTVFMCALTGAGIALLLDPPTIPNDPVDD
jgi:hypothetical protein